MTCSICGKRLRRGNYYGRADGSVRRVCKACERGRVREWRREHPELDRAKDRRKAPRFLAARRAVARAIARGELERPERCERCGKRGPVEAHHEDYGKPLDVTWLCPGCHRQRHQERARTIRIGKWLNFEIAEVAG